MRVSIFTFYFYCPCFCDKEKTKDKLSFNLYNVQCTPLDVLCMYHAINTNCFVASYTSAIAWAGLRYLVWVFVIYSALSG